jgi:hypothetical protein
MVLRENHLFRCTRPKPRQGSVLAGLTFASDFGFRFQHNVGSSLVLRRPIETTPRASNDGYCATCIAGGCQVPSPAGRMEGGSVFGQYKRMTKYIGPSGAGSQLAFLSPAGGSF